ncbi:hypothetical protein ABK040_009562 [Willaertia magna]
MGIPASKMHPNLGSSGGDQKTIKSILGEDEYCDDVEYDCSNMCDCKEMLLKCNKIYRGYKIDKLIGKGTYSQVYKVIKEDNKSVYALKCCYFRNLSEQKYANNEIQILSQFNHQNIVKYFEHFELDCLDQFQKQIKLICIVIEYCNGGCLAEYLRHNKHLNTSIFLLMDWIIQSIKVMNDFHSQNLIHRDIKPHNLLLHTPTSNARTIVKLCDFSFVIKDTQDKTEDLNTFCGSLIYLAPEVNRMKYSKAVDIYSLGITFLQILSKSHCNEFCGKMYHRDFTVINNFINRIPLKSLRELIKQMVDCNPENRITLNQLCNHSVIFTFECYILQNYSLLSSNELKQADTIFLITLFELLEYHKTELTHFINGFQMLQLLFETKSFLIIDEIQKQFDNLINLEIYNHLFENENLEEHLNIEIENCFLFLFISIINNLNEDDLKNNYQQSSTDNTLINEKNNILDSLGIISMKSVSETMNRYINEEFINLLNNTKIFILSICDLLKKRNENYIILFLNHLLNSIILKSNLFLIDNSFYYLLLKELIINFSICKKELLRENTQNNENDILRQDIITKLRNNLIL